VKHGLKFFLSAVFMVQGLAIVALSYVLALAGKLTPEWVQIASIWLPMAGGVIGVFSASNAYVSGKALDAGVAAPDEQQA
jgi:hypothetical protein